MRQIMKMQFFYLLQFCVNLIDPSTRRNVIAQTTINIHIETVKKILPTTILEI